jgi:TonB family protein
LSSTGSSGAPTANASPERRRLTQALLLSLLIHTWLLSLTFGGQGLWLPGFAFPWQDRRVEVPDLRVVVVPARVTAAEPAVTPIAEPSQQAQVVEQPVVRGPAPTPSMSRAPTPRRPAKMPLRADRPGDTAAPPTPAPPVVASERTGEATGVVPAAPAMPTPVITAAPSISIPEAPMPSLGDAGDAALARIDQEAWERAVELPKLDPSKQEGQRQDEQLEAARQDAARQEAARAENARLEAERREAAQQAADLQEAARQRAARAEAAKVDAAKIEAAKVEAAKVEAAKVEAAKVEAAKVEAAKVEAAKVDAARVEAAKVEAARVEAAKVEAAKVEAAKVEAAKVEAARVEAAKVEAAKVEAARVEAARAEAAKIEAARVEAARVEAARVEAARAEAAKIEAAKVEAAARREAALRAIGRQLDEEAARREAAAAARLPPSWSPARRYRLWGRTDPNAEIILYAEAWSRKIQLNMTFDLVREAAKQPHTDPLVTVAIRSDGSVESVTIVQSSGVAALDDAIRRIVDSQKPYRVFPPGLASEFDVIEIRRTWHFDMAIRLD